jgi:hypothetical protein
MRHACIKLKFLRELKEAGLVEVEWCNTENMPADLFTKHLGGSHAAVFFATLTSPLPTVIPPLVFFMLTIPSSWRVMCTVAAVSPIQMFGSITKSDCPERSAIHRQYYLKAVRQWVPTAYRMQR